MLLVWFKILRHLPSVGVCQCDIWIELIKLLGTLEIGLSVGQYGPTFGKGGHKEHVVYHVRKQRFISPWCKHPIGSLACGFWRPLSHENILIFSWLLFLTVLSPTFLYKRMYLKQSTINNWIPSVEAWLIKVWAGYHGIVHEWHQIFLGLFDIPSYLVLSSFTLSDNFYPIMSVLWSNFEPTYTP